MLLLILALFYGADKFIQGQLADVVGEPTAPPMFAPVPTPASTPAPQLPMSLIEFMGGQGCTFTPARDVATLQQGFDPYEIDRLITQSLAQGTANMQGEYVVLDASICTIRLPDIQSDFTIESPEIKAVTLYISEEYSDGIDMHVDEGCFIDEPLEQFIALADGDMDTGFAAYMQFLGAALIAGDLRFYSDSPLRTSRGFQVVSGTCATAPNVEFIEASRPLIATGFGQYVRRIGEITPCDDSAWRASMIAADIQGVDTSADAPLDPKINAWLWFEWQLITMSAGWHEGMTVTSPGKARPPLCHYPE